MLGKVVQKQRQPPKPVISTKLRDAILEGWTETRSGSVATLKGQDETWNEFWLHASATKKWCPRMAALSAMFGTPSEEHKAETLWNFGQGHAYHWLFQSKMLGSLGAVFMGAWRRFVPVKDEPGKFLESVHLGVPVVDDGEERDIVRGWCEKPEEDQQTDGWVRNGWEYIESKVRMLKYRIVVKFDAVLRWKDDGEEIFELKTEKEGAREQLDPQIGGVPRQQHVEQVNLAMWASGIKRARIVYMFKGEYTLKRSLIEHVLEYDPAVIERLKDMALKCVEAVRAVDAFKDDNPDASDEEKMAFVEDHFERDGDCPMKSKGKARYCAQRDMCFQKKKK